VGGARIKGENKEGSESGGGGDIYQEQPRQSHPGDMRRWRSEYGSMGMPMLHSRQHCCHEQHQRIWALQGIISPKKAGRPVIEGPNWPRGLPPATWQVLKGGCGVEKTNDWFR